jgi:Lar family restriction alleviation protein
MTTKLENCPFCGSDKLETIYSNHAFIRCLECGAEGSKFPKRYGEIAEHIDLESAIKAWNLRCPHDAKEPMITHWIFSLPPESEGE